MVKRVWFMLWAAMFLNVVCAEEQPAVTERLLLTQQIQLARSPVSVKVWLDSRQTYQQQALVVHVKASYPKKMGTLSLSARIEAQSQWLSPWVPPEPETSAIDENMQESAWSVLLFSKQVGINELPHLQLQVEGPSMSRQWLTVPDVSIRVLPLPLYLPAQTVVASIEDWQSDMSVDFWRVVAEPQQRHVQMKLVNIMPQSIPMLPAVGENVSGLSPLVKMSDPQWEGNRLITLVDVWQPWQVSEMGAWSLSPQDMWFFDPKTLKTMHIQLPGIEQGYAITSTLWTLLKTVMLMVSSMLIAWLLWRLYQWRRWLHFRQDLAKSPDVNRLLLHYRQFYRWPMHIPLSQLAKKQLAYAELMALESFYFSGHIMYGDQFEQLKADLLQRLPK